MIIDGETYLTHLFSKWTLLFTQLIKVHETIAELRVYNINQKNLFEGKKYLFSSMFNLYLIDQT